MARREDTAHWRDPDLKLGGFSLWIFGREREKAEDYWDGNWLRAKARMSMSGAVVEAEGSIIRVDELDGFARDLKKLIRTLNGKAELNCLEPNLNLTLDIDRLGGVTAKLSITPDHLTQSHQFEFGIDQSYLPPVLRACEHILEEYPMKGSPSD